MNDHTERRRARQGGMTLVELLIGMLMLSIVMAICVSVFMVMNRTVSTTDARTQDTDQARLAVQQIDRQIRSGNVFYDPGDEAAPGFVLRVYTQANGDQKCVLWRVTNGTLETRSWEPSDLANATTWRRISGGIVNTAAAPPFTLATDTNYGQRLIEILIQVNSAPGKRGNVEFRAAVAGRNTEYGYSRTTCNGTPT